MQPAQTDGVGLFRRRLVRSAKIDWNAWTMCFTVGHSIPLAYTLCRMPVARIINPCWRYLTCHDQAQARVMIDWWVFQKSIVVS